MDDVELDKQNSNVVILCEKYLQEDSSAMMLLNQVIHLIADFAWIDERAEDEEFDNAVKSALFLEWANFAGARYGTPRKPVEDALRDGKSVLLEIEIAGAKQVKERAPEAVLVFLEPPSWEELVSRLEGRGTDSPERRAARLELAQEELAQAGFFDISLVNERVEEVVAHLISLVTQR